MAMSSCIGYPPGVFCRMGYGAGLSESIIRYSQSRISIDAASYTKTAYQTGNLLLFLVVKYCCDYPCTYRKQGAKHDQSKVWNHFYLPHSVFVFENTYIPHSINYLFSPRSFGVYLAYIIGNFEPFANGIEKNSRRARM